MVSCVNNIIQPQIDKYANYGKLYFNRRVAQIIKRNKKKKHV